MQLVPFPVHSHTDFLIAMDYLAIERGLDFSHLLASENNLTRYTHRYSCTIKHWSWVMSRTASSQQRYRRGGRYVSFAGSRNRLGSFWSRAHSRSYYVLRIYSMARSRTFFGTTTERVR